MKWYHEWKQNATNQFLAGHYPGHERVPNIIVWSLYWLGHFVGDFVPLILNLIDGVYLAIKRLLAFIVGLLIEASTVIVLIGTIAFSIAHSIELLRRAGATGGLEYVGVLMFEIVFISSTATLTGMLMSRRPNLIKTAGFWFCSAGFIVGIVFVLWSNVSAMTPSWEGWTIGIMTPVLLIIAEGLLAYRYMDGVDSTKMAQAGYIPQDLQWLQENNVSFEEIILAVEAFRKELPETEVGSPKQQVQDYRTEQTEGSDTQNVSGSREEENLKSGDLEWGTLETSHLVSSHLETGGTQNLETSRLENRETGDLEEKMETPELGDQETGELEKGKLEELETGDLGEVKLEISKLEETKLEVQENLVGGDLEGKPEESITNWKSETLNPEVEKQGKPASFKASTLQVDKLEETELEKLETSRLEELVTGELETSRLEDLEVEAGESSKLENLEAGELEGEALETSRLEKLEQKLETPKPETGELEGEKQENSKVENQEGKFTKEDLEHFSREELEAMEGADPEEIATRILERQGKIPGRTRVMRLTGHKEWPVRQALSKLKKKEQNAS